VKRACALLLLAVIWPRLAAAADYDKCAAIVADAERLACYDQAAGRVAPPAPVPAEAVSYLGKLWELDEVSKKGVFHFREHKPVYILPLHYSNDPNESPTSPAPSHSALVPVEADNIEVKYQLSFKTKLWEEIIGDYGDLWFAYTQQSHWLLYSPSVSSPFRETNYEPELIFSIRTDVELLGMRWRMLNLGLSHQSNGRDLPLSRSWNRLYAQFGLERGDYSLLLRPWVRLPEPDDDNPDISRYMGHGEVLLNYKSGESLYSVLGRYSSSGDHGALQLSWDFPISRALKGYLQLFSGYGESLIDYNHNQTSFGLGVALREWR
jgi:phospholipase A1